MLRGSSLSTVSVIRSHSYPEAVLRALGESRGSDTVQVIGHQDGVDLLALTLDIYVQSLHQAATAATAVTRAPYEKPDIMSIFARKCSWAALQQLRKDVLQVVGDDDGSHHCEQCAQLAEFLEHAFERPAVFDRTWGGAMVLSAAKVTHFVNTLLRLVCALPKEDANENHPQLHEKAAAIVSSFLVPDWKKTE